MKRTLFLLLASLALTLPMLAQIPVYLNHQGYIADSTGIGVTGTLPMTFRFFDDSTGGLAILTDSRAGVDLSKGIFSVNIDVSSLSFSSQYWLETEVDGQTLSPRARLTASPYARRAVVADSALTVKDGSVTSAKVQNGSLQRADVTTTFKSPYADTADYAKAAFPGADGFTDDGAVVRLTSPGDNVGIGTASPSKKLEVSGDALVTDTLFTNKVKISDGTQGSGKILTSDGSGVASWQSPGQAGFPSGSEGQVMRYSGSEWGASPDLSVDTNGRVGIGTTSPTHRLDVSGSAAVSDTVYANKVKISDGTQGSGKILTSDGSGVASWQSPGQAGFPSGAEGQVMRYSGSEWGASPDVSIDTNGRVGIGTTSPTQKLEVSGDAKIGGTLTAAAVSSNSPLLLQTDGTTRVFVDDSAGLVGVGTLTPSHRLDVSGSAAVSDTFYGNKVKITDGTEGSGKILTSDGSGIASWQSPGQAGFPSGSEGQVMRYSGSEWGASPDMSIDTNGRVGIGTTSPSRKLEVVGSAKVSDTLFASNLSSNSPLLLQTSGTTRVFVDDSAGLVGVGTLTPSHRLDVSGSAAVSDTVYANKVKISDGTQGSGKILTSDGSGVASWQAPGQAGFPSGADGQMMRYDGSQWEASDAVYSDSSRKIGIGTTAPQRMLTVVDTTSEANRQVTELAHGTGDANFRLVTMNGEASNSTGTPMVKMGMVYGAPGGATSSLIRFHRGVAGFDGAISFSTNNDVERVRIATNGYMGIGTSTPASPLHVAAPDQVTVLAQNTSGTLDAGFRAMTSAGQWDMFMNRWGAGATTFSIGSGAGAGTNWLSIRNTGQVGLGTNTPVNKLDVEGAAVIGTSFSGTYTAPANGLLVQGLVGIGTTSPVNPLSVLGNANVTGNLTVSKLTVTGSVAATGLDLSSADQYAEMRVIRNSLGAGDKDMFLQFQAGLGSEMHLFSNNAETMTLSAGRVGIGTVSPGTSLDVNGAFRSTGGYSYLNQSADNSQGNVGIGVGPSTVVKLYVSSNQLYTLYSSNLVGSYAGYFVGNVTVTGLLSKGGGSFKIDHPVDPDNKWLYHSFVESPDMMNVYNGNVVTDGSGMATVELPDYFEALNKDFRYQLTVVGQFAQAIVESKVRGNRFAIRTDKPNVEVSWQVTGIRKDAFANAHRIVPVVDKKTDEKGKYLYPKELGKPESMGMEPVEAQPVKEDRQ